MAQSAFQSLRNLGYDSQQEQELQTALENDMLTNSFLDAVAWLSGQLTTLLGLEENVNPINLPAFDGNSHNKAFRNFLLELSGMLRVLECPYKVIMDAPLEQKLNLTNRRLVLVFLITELQATQLCLTKQAKQTEERVFKPNTPVGEMLNAIATSVHMQSMPNSPQQFWAHVLQFLEQSRAKYGQNLFGHPFLNYPNQQLSPEDWQLIEKLNDTLNLEYRARRQMLLKRIDVTLSSFSWAGKAQGKADELKQKVYPVRSGMSSDAYVSIPLLLAARTDLLLHEKTTSSKLRASTKSNINKVLMGPVPDRGGRCDGSRPGASSMPSFQTRREGPGNFGRGGGGGGRAGHPSPPRRGGRVQGSWDRGHRAGSHHNQSHTHQQQQPDFAAQQPMGDRQRAQRYQDPPEMMMDQSGYQHANANMEMDTGDHNGYQQHGGTHGGGHRGGNWRSRGRGGRGHQPW